MPYAFHTADVFTDHLHGGNPLAVIPDARGLSDAQMQAITREFNYSETVFVFPPATKGNTRSVRIFTPNSELPFAGHPTVGCAFVLASIGAIPLDGGETRIILEEGVGPIPVLIRARDGKPVFAQLTSAMMPEINDPPPPPETLCEILSLEPSHIVADDMIEPEAVSCGVPYLFIPLKKPEMLSWVKVDTLKWEQRCELLGAEMFGTARRSGTASRGGDIGRKVRSGWASAETGDRPRCARLRVSTRLALRDAQTGPCMDGRQGVRWEERAGGAGGRARRGQPPPIKVRGESGVSRDIHLRAQLSWCLGKHLY